MQAGFDRLCTEAFSRHPTSDRRLNFGSSSKGSSPTADPTRYPPSAEGRRDCFPGPCRSRGGLGWLGPLARATGWGPVLGRLGCLLGAGQRRRLYRPRAV